MTASATKSCWVAYATPERQYLWSVDVPLSATIGDVVAAARKVANQDDVPWDSAPVGVFGETRARSYVPESGDRIELYRPLKNDPREQRRERVQQARKGR